ncbi:MAG: lipid-A-disaccharide synthase N-terminal domain-containing protein [Phycisphaerales bacterium]
MDALYRILNVDSPAGLAWVALGFLGELIFAGRMLVQWIVSERRGESVVTPIFWWMSLVGSAMLVAYFLWRRDLVGVFGQFAIFIYVRNLMLIARHRERELARQARAEGLDQP